MHIIRKNFKNHGALIKAIIKEQNGSELVNRGLFYKLQLHHICVLFVFYNDIFIAHYIMHEKYTL